MRSWPLTDQLGILFIYLKKNKHEWIENKHKRIKIQVFIYLFIIYLKKNKHERI